MAESPAVSIVLPTRDRVASLRRAVASVRRQTFRSWELVVVDDGSTDETSELVAALVAEDQRVRFVRSDPPVGAAVARNRGASATDAPVLAFLDDDAEWMPEKLDRQLNALHRTSSCGLVYCRTEFVRPDGRSRIVGSTAAACPVPSRALLRSNDIDTSAVLVRRGDFEAVGGFDERLPRLQDWDLWIRLGDRSSFVFVDQTLVCSHFSPGGISTRSDALVEACRILARKFEARLHRDPEGMADGLHALGHMLMIGGAPAEGRRFLRLTMRARPRRLRRWIMTALAHVGATPYGWASTLHARFRGVRWA